MYPLSYYERLTTELEGKAIVEKDEENKGPEMQVYVKNRFSDNQKDLIFEIKDLNPDSQYQSLEINFDLTSEQVAIVSTGIFFSEQWDNISIMGDRAIHPLLFLFPYSEEVEEAISDSYSRFNVDIRSNTIVTLTINLDSTNAKIKPTIDIWQNVLERLYYGFPGNYSSTVIMIDSEELDRPHILGNTSDIDKVLEEYSVLKNLIESNIKLSFIFIHSNL